MKFTSKRLLPIIISLLIILSLPLSGCCKVPDAVSKVVSRVSEVLRGTPAPNETAREAAQETARPVDGQGQSSLIPLDEIFAAPEYTSPVLSSDGKTVLFRHISPDGSKDDIIARNIKTGMETVVPYPEGTNGIPYFDWSGDNRHVLFTIDASGNENYAIYSVDITTGESKQVFAKEGATAYIITTDKANPNGIYFETNERDSQVFDLFWCDIATGESKLVMENPGQISSWYFDMDSRLRMVKVLDDDGGERVLMKKDGAAGGTAFSPGDWQEIIHWSYGDIDNSGVLGFSADGKRISYVDSTGRNTAAIMEMDLASGAKKLIDSDPVYDASSSWQDLKKDRVTAVRYTRERSEWKPLEEDIAKQFDKVSSLNKGDFGFASTSADDRYWLIYFDNDTEGRSYYYVDTVTGDNKYLFNETPVLKKYEFSPMEPIVFKSADGLDIHGYATYPLGRERKNLPMVLYVHGGPKYRDEWGFNSEVQWLANRGYMVLQVNFRGSTGYGKEFVKAGDREWGGKMQQDLTDAVNWAVAQGYADRSRVAIMGASYGGYAALAGAAFTPGVYACAIDMFGPSSLITLVKSTPSYWKPYLEQMYQSIGDPAKDEAFMKSRSPLYSVDNIKIPVLIAQGGNDVRVTPQESEQMVAAMKARDLDVQYMYFPDAGHGFNTTEDYHKFFTEAEAFLAEHLGGKTT